MHDLSNFQMCEAYGNLIPHNVCSKRKQHVFEQTSHFFSDQIIKYNKRFFFLITNWPVINLMGEWASHQSKGVVLNQKSWILPQAFIDLGNIILKLYWDHQCAFMHKTIILRTIYWIQTFWSLIFYASFD